MCHDYPERGGQINSALTVLLSGGWGWGRGGSSCLFLWNPTSEFIIASFCIFQTISSLENRVEFASSMTKLVMKFWHVPAPVNGVHVGSKKSASVFFFVLPCWQCSSYPRMETHSDCFHSGYFVFIITCFLYLGLASDWSPWRITFGMAN